ncbi:PP2C family protein-serine/threonine phosphatase [Planctomyces sp. SH-PL14]|uniref:PP2C family protein-serine/threonine phosphatase n=1 Tax=Planctomyces sp. SH-PL14 TaxID=1632864 RepID=UPI00078E894F|nr:protein phosphatase 2C domain-containing protein [Planctomyces sp. SH-PL14]AMV16273.1 Putative protein phosphatase 2C-type [Planctomyces sp. SH-PL14]
MRWEQKIQFATLSDVGLRRSNNEDSLAVAVANTEEDFENHGHLFLVADGMGGHAVGELASKIAAETVPHTYLKQDSGDFPSALEKSVIEANTAINTRGEQNQDFLKMGTTCSTLVLCPEGAFIGHVGDSRIYRVRRDRIDQLSFDHSLHWELQRRDQKLAAQIDLSLHKNVITRCLGPEPKVMVDVEGPHPILPADGFILCSDGLSNLVADEEMGAIVRDLAPNVACRLLIDLANARGGTDNCTAIVVKVGDLPANVPPPFVPDEPQAPSLGWAWLFAFWGAAMLFIWGLALLFFGHPWKGIILTALAGFGGVGMLLVSFRQRRKLIEEHVDQGETHIARAHRTAVALDSKQLFEVLATVETQLRRPAQDDHWEVDWAKHEEAIKAAAKGKSEKRHAKACRDLARAIELIMTQLPASAREKPSEEKKKPAEKADGKV